MVEVSLYVTLIAFEVTRTEVITNGQRLFPIAHTMTFEVGFGTDIKSVLVAKVIPIVVVGIVAGAHGIDVHLLHFKYVLEHALATDHIASIGVKFMTVSTLDKDGLTIDEKLRDTSDLVADFNASEAHLKRNNVDDLRALTQGSGELIKIGHLGAPCIHLLHVEFHRLRQGRSRQCGRNYFVSIGISKNEIDLAPTLNCSVDSEYTILVIIGKVANYADVIETILSTTSIKITITVEATIAEIVLILEVMSVTHAQYLHGNKVLLPHLYIFSKVEFGFEFVVFTITHKFAIDPKVHATTRSAKVGNNLLPAPRSRNSDVSPIIADMIFLDGHKRRIALGTMIPDETTAHIDGVSEAIEFPASGHGDGFPIRSFVLRLIEAVEHLVGIWLPEEVPSSIKRLITLRSFGPATIGNLSTFVGKVMSMHGHTVHLIDVGPLPGLGSIFGHSWHSRYLVKALRNLQWVFELRLGGLVLCNDCCSH